MAKKLKLKKKVKNPNEKPNYVLWTGIVIILIPLVVLAYILISSIEKTGEPVIGNRFDDELDPAITTEQVNKVKEQLNFEQVENVEVNLKAATLRITINVKDDTSEESIKNLLNESYNKVNETLPVETYFTNKENVKMYDLEIHVYNVIPDETTTISQIHYVRTKTGGAETYTDNVDSRAKDEELANTLLNPNKGTTEEGN